MMCGESWRGVAGARLLGKIRPSKDTSRPAPWWFVENKEPKIPTKSAAAPAASFDELFSNNCCRKRLDIEMKSLLPQLEVGYWCFIFFCVTGLMMSAYFSGAVAVCDRV